MWAGFVSVDSSYDPIIYEGEGEAKAVVLNVGPAPVEIRAWDKPGDPGERRPVILITLLPGNIRSVAGALIRAKLSDNVNYSLYPLVPPHLHAAVGWFFF